MEMQDLRREVDAPLRYWDSHGIHLYMGHINAYSGLWSTSTPEYV